MATSAATLIGQADQAAAGGDIARAIQLLRKATADGLGGAEAMLKLAALLRAAGQPREALAAVHRALEASPLDFMALLMRATLLDRLGDPAADQAWSHALAQKPRGPLPPQVAAVVEEGERRHAAWLDQREERMRAAMAQPESAADDEQRARIARFRTNVLRRTRAYHSEPTDFHFPGLTEREFHPRRMFPWIDELEARTGAIAAELEAVMRAERAELVPYVQYEAHQPLDQWRPLNHNLDWTAIHLLRNGRSVEANARHCPATMALLESLPQPHIAGAGPNAMFSLLAPGTAIPPHVGVNNARLVCHLPLVVPDGCWFRVGAETRFWKRGEAFVFDDTIEHEAMNPSGELRVVFIFDVWNPELAPVERDAIAALIGAEGAADGGL